MSENTDILQVSEHICLSINDIDIRFIRAQGAGGQNVNKVSSAVHLRFDIKASSLAEQIKERLLNFNDHHITDEGVIIIKAQRFRTQEQNREDALIRLVSLIQKSMVTRKKRLATKPTKASKKRRLESKTKGGKQKQLRKKVNPHSYVGT